MTVSAVVDASVLIAAPVDTGSQGEWAEDVLAGGGLCAPELARVEATHILRRLERAKELALPGAAQEDLLQLRLELFSFDPFADRIRELRHTITSYDAWHVAVASAQVAPCDVG